MKHIDKTTLHAPSAYVTELHAAHLDEANILSHHPGKSGRQLFNMVKHLASYAAMKQKLMEDQGYVCCYCNRSIPIAGHKVVTEHVKPVSAHQNLAGEYKNLLVCCDGGELIPPTPVGVTPPYSRSNYPLHCDKAKAHQEIPVSPLDANCENRFVYDPVTGKIDGVAGDTDASDTATILNFEHPILKKERREEIWHRCYDGSGNLLSEAQLYATVTLMLTPYPNGHYRNLYFVVASAALNLV